MAERPGPGSLAETRETELRDYLSGVARLRQQARQAEGFAYAGFEDLVLRRGTFWPGSPRPRGVPKMANRQCFQNAWQIAETHGWTYCEGWATSIIPTHHAWVLNQAGAVIDPTWDDPESCVYAGLPLERSFVAKVLLSSGTYGVFYKPEARVLLDNSPEEPIHDRPQ